MHIKDTAHLRRRVRVISYFMALTLVLITAVLRYENEKARLGRIIENSYQRAFAELAVSIDSMNTSLEKSLYVTSPMMVSSLCTDIYAKSVAAQMCLEALPFSSSPLEKTAGFIAKTGDYACTLSRLAAAGECPDEDALNTLSELRSAADRVAQELLYLQSEIYANGLDIMQAERAAEGEDEELQSVQSSVEVTENDFPELPSLIYDGPFSEHIEAQKSVMIENEREVSQNEAAQIAADFLNVAIEFVDYEGKCDSNRVPVWCYSCAKRDSRLYINVTRKGGRVISVYGSFGTLEERLNEAEAVNIADVFLMSRGFENMKATYTQKSGGAVTINYAPLQDNVLLYPDLVKVKVALDDGSIIGFDSQGYIASHRERQIPSEEIDPAKAQMSISSRLTVLSSSLCIIPTA
ncbi:MAG: germination protein YpeB, partial [Oscillospiraceae bacterium]|nr:germination protein YpeB [Oscillospiraceae bacterium]